MKRSDPKTSFAAAFHALAEEKPVDRITVGEICRLAGRSPATFYRHFHDKYELAAWDYTLHVAEIANRIGQDGYAWPDALRDHLNMHWRNREYLSNLLTHTHGRDSFVLNMTTVNISLARNLVSEGDDASPSQELDLCIRLYCHGVVQVICEWITGGLESDPASLARWMESGLQNPLRPYLLPRQQNERNLPISLI